LNSGPQADHLRMSPALSVVGIFRIVSKIYAWIGLSHDPPIYASCVARMVAPATTPRFYWDGGLMNFLPQTGLKLEAS
jgi:hypothetical protein